MTSLASLSRQIPSRKFCFLSIASVCALLGAMSLQARAQQPGEDFGDFELPGGAADAGPMEPPADDAMEEDDNTVPFLPPGMQLSQEGIDRYMNARQLYREGKYVEALGEIAPMAGGEIYAASVLQAQCLAGLDQYDLAIDTMDDLMKYKQPNWQWLEIRGDIEMEAERFSQAADDFQAATALNPTDLDLFSKLGMARVRLGMQLRGTPNRGAAFQELSAGVEALTTAIDGGIEDAELYLHRGIAESEVGDLDATIDDYEAAQALDPDNGIYAQLLGFSYLRRGNQMAILEPEKREEISDDLNASLKSFDRAIQLDPGQFGTDDSDEETPAAEEDEEVMYFEQFEPPTVYAARATAETALGDFYDDPQASRDAYQAAINDCDLALELDPTLVSAIVQKGIAQRMLENFEGAISSFTRALELSPGLSDALLRRGIAWYRLGEYDLAIMDFDDMELYGVDPRASFWIGLCEASRGNYYDAISAYSKTLRQTPNHMAARANRGLAYLELGEAERALADFNELIRLDQKNASAYYYRGLALEAMDNPEGATRSYQRALHWDDQQEGVQERLDALSAR